MFYVNFMFDLNKENYIVLYDFNGKILIDEVIIFVGQFVDCLYVCEKDGSVNWVVKGEGEYSYVILSINNMIIDKNLKIENFKKYDFIGIGMVIIVMLVVFIGLVFLYFLFKVVGNVVVRLGKKNVMKVIGIIDKMEVKEKNLGSYIGEEIVVIVMVLYEYLNDVYDVEDMILIINKVKCIYLFWSLKIYILCQILKR